MHRQQGGEEADMQVTRRLTLTSAFCGPLAAAAVPLSLFPDAAVAGEGSTFDYTDDIDKYSITLPSGMESLLPAVSVEEMCPNCDCDSNDATAAYIRGCRQVHTS
jgi:hypothetical protein